MKHILLLLIIITMLASCMTLDEKALNAGYIKASDCPTIPEASERYSLPHPLVPIFEMVDENGAYRQPSMNEVLELVIKYGATISKFQYLVEIYEREYLNVEGSSLFENLSLEELRVEYLIRIGKMTKTNPIDSAPIDSAPIDSAPIDSAPINSSRFTTDAAIVRQTNEELIQDYLMMVEYMNLTNIKYNEE